MNRIDDDQIEGKLLLFVADLLTVLLLTVGCAVSFLSGYQLMRLDMGAVLVFCTFSGAVAAVLHRLNQPWAALGAAAALGGIFWLAWEKIAPSLAWIARKMNLLPVLTGLPLDFYRPDGDELLPAVLLLCAVLAWLMGWIAVRARRWYLAALLSFILILPAIQSGVLPAWGAMLAVFAGWGSLLLTSLYGKNDPGGLARAQLLALGGMAGFILILVLALPMEGYTRPQWATDARNNLILGVTRRLERFMDLDELNQGILADLGIDLSVPGQGGGHGASGGNGGGAGGVGEEMREDLLKAGPRRYSGQRVLSLRTELKSSGRIYLKGNSLGVYTGNSWEMVEGEYPFFPNEFLNQPESEPSLFPAETVDGARYTMFIRDVLRRGVYYYPYQPAFADGWFSESGWLTLSEDRGGSVAEQMEYEVDYVPGSPEEYFLPLSGAAAMREETYRYDVVQRYYRDAPPEAVNQLMVLVDREEARETWDMLLMFIESELESSDETLREQLEEIQENARNMREQVDDFPSLEDFGGPAEIWDGMDTRSRFEAVITTASRIAQVLEATAEYDPNTPAMPDDAGDFMGWFLQERRGYCIHFATAGALLLRMQGIPARYTTGYVAQLDGNGQGVALDRDAHAWVEVYIDGYGWYPVEMTPGYAGGESGVELVGAAATEGMEEIEDIEPDNPEDALEDEEETLEDAPEETELPGEDAGEEAAKFVFPWKGVLSAALILAALAGAYALALLPRKFERELEDANRSVICAYRRYRRALHWGGVEIETVEELARKAKFSQHALSEEEKDAVWRGLDDAAARVRARMPKWGRFLFPVLKPLL